MEVYALFRKNKYFQCAIVQGKEFTEVGDEKWIARTSALNRIFGNNDWIEITRDDLEKYKQNYTRGEDGKPVAPVPLIKSIDEQIADLKIKFFRQLKSLRQDIVDAKLAGADSSLIQAEYDKLIETSNAQFLQLMGGDDNE